MEKKATQQDSTVVSARMLLEMVQAGEHCDDPQLQDDGESLRSWMIHKLKFRTIEIPAPLLVPYERLLANYRERKAQ